MEQTFSKARFDLYRNSEAIQLAYDVVKSCNDNNAVTLKIDAATNALGSLCAIADNAFSTNAGSNLTEEIVALDHLRDEGITGIKQVAMGWAKHKNQTKKEAAKLIVASLKKFSTNIAQQNLATETTILRNWYDDVQSNAALKAALTTLDLLAWADDVNNDNNAFNAKYVLRSQQIGNNQNLETVGEVLPNLVRQFKKLLHRIDSLNNLDETNAYKALIDKINGLIKQYNDRAKTRISSGNTTTPATPTA